MTETQVMNGRNSRKPLAAPRVDGARGTSARPERVDVAVIGAGQAGLAIGYFLARQGRRFVSSRPLTRWDPPGGNGGTHWSSSRRAIRRASRTPFPGDPDGYPARDEVIAYLGRYARRVRPSGRVTAGCSLRHAVRTLPDQAGGHDLVADQVVVATGPFQRPLTPGAPTSPPEVPQMHSVSYCRPMSSRGRVLVVGGGNTGFQIAKECPRVRQSTLRSVPANPASAEDPRPRPVLVADQDRAHQKTVDSRIGSRAQPGHADRIQPTGTQTAHGVACRPRVVGASGRTVTFADGSEHEWDAVIWATGYRPDHSWIDVPGFSRRSH